MWRSSSWIASRDLACASRNQCLILAKSFSIGLRSGEYFGRKNRRAPALRMGGADLLTLMGAEIVQDDDVAGFEFRHQNLLDIDAEAFAIDRAIEDKGSADARSALSAATKVMVFQWPKGA